MTESDKQALRLELLHLLATPGKPMQVAIADVEEAYEFITREKVSRFEQQQEAAQKAASYNPNPFPEQGE